MLERQPVPYEDGNHCIFYAVQAASMHFSGEPLTIDDRVHYQEEIQRLSGKLDKIPGGGIQATVEMMLSKLKPKGILPRRYGCTNFTRTILTAIDDLQNKDVSFQAFEDSDLLDAPVLLFTQTDLETQKAVDAHVWFIPSPQSFEAERLKHIKPNDKIVLAIELKKEKTTTNS